MSVVNLSATKEVVFERVVLENGLTVLVQTMPEYSTVHAIYGTKFGSVNRCYTINESKSELPAGIAHFLEHKMFENEQGDAFELYAKTGAAANAYTSFDKTCYIFTATNKIEENLDILLSFVSQPYFTQKTVSKEQGIIGQEIKMYDDSANWQLLMGTLKCMYKNHYLRDDIAGSVESIAKITPEMLYECTELFYNTKNMVLAVAGNVSLDTVIKACERANLKPSNKEVKEIIIKEPDTIMQKDLTINMEVAKPHICIAFKEKPLEGTPQNILKQEIICDMLTELICGNMTPLYRKLYDENIVSPGFSGDFLSVNGALSILFTGETNECDKVKDLLFNEIKSMRDNGVDEEVFKLCKNLMYGEMVSDLENVEDVASSLSNSFFKGYTSAQAFETLALLSVDDVNNALQNMLNEQKSVVVTICKKS